MTTYKFKYRRHLFFKTITVIGHTYDGAMDKMTLFLPDGGQRELKNWRNCEALVGADCIAAIQKKMEDQAGVSIPLKV